MGNQMSCFPSQSHAVTRTLIPSDISRTGREDQRAQRLRSQRAEHARRRKLEQTRAAIARCEEYLEGIRQKQEQDCMRKEFIHWRKEKLYKSASGGKKPQFNPILSIIEEEVHDGASYYPQ